MPATVPSSESEPASARDTRSAGRDLPLAVASGLALAAVFVGTLLWNPYAFLTFFTALVLLALLELDVAVRRRELRPATPVAVGAGVVMVYGAYTSGPSAQSLGLVLLVFGAMAWTLLDASTGDDGHRRPRHVTASLGATCLMTLWVPFLGSFVGLLLARESGVWYLLSIVALTVACDVGGYAFGSRFGRHKLAPRISPGKTWEGLAGGLLAVWVLAALVATRLPGFDLVAALALGSAVVVAATLGDLAESLVKRDLGLKDLGKVLPGHGGIMDRADGIIFVLPAAHFFLVALGL
ncbi:MAG TPA: phosphatidate cytidylyltransferase [Egibacteraceae bacterium]|nr:phosphatidate cytidylyltransferase [Actinomycetota bacterium]HWB71453.1 phosphatidate cytidylyltransferase [Egibacteraceae bacterium]